MLGSVSTVNMQKMAVMWQRIVTCAVFILLLCGCWSSCDAAQPRLQWEKRDIEVWLLKTYDQRYWHEEGVKYCRDLKLDDKYDWRMPTLKELKTLLTISAGRRRYTARVERGIYWSATPYGGDGRRFWALSFITEQSAPMTTHNYNRVVCVRTVRK